MFAEMIRLFQERGDFFLQLTLEHIAISLTAIVLAIVIGGAMGILIAEVDRMSSIFSTRSRRSRCSAFFCLFRASAIRRRSSR